MSTEMLQLWGAVAVLCMAVLGILLPSMIRKRTQVPAQREAYDIKIYKDQLEEVERDIERGLLADDQATATRTEIKRRMLAAADAGSTEEARYSLAEKTNWSLVSFVAVALPLGAIVLYLGLGDPSLPDQPLAGRDMSEAIVDTQRRTELSNSVAQLVERLKSKPDDVRGWILLGRSYEMLERYDDAARALEKAYMISGESSDIGSAYGEALTLAAKSTVTTKAMKVFETVLTDEPTDTKARYYLGMRKAQQGDIKGALQDWVDLAALSPENAPWMEIVSDQIERAAQETGVDPQSVTPSLETRELAAKLRIELNESPIPATGQTSGPTREDMEAASQMTEDDRAAMIRSMVDRLANRLTENPNDKEGWIRLERAYRVLGETAKADEAAARIAELP